MTTRSVLIAIPSMLIGWLVVMLVTALLTDEAPAYVVLFPTDGFLQSLPNEISMISASVVSVTLTSEQDGFVPLLYRSGAWIVLPAGLTGCLPMPKAD